MKIDSLKLQLEIARLQMTLSDFAQKAGVSNTTICRVVYGGQTTVKVLGKISAALGKEPEELILQEDAECTTR